MKKKLLVLISMLAALLYVLNSQIGYTKDYQKKDKTTYMIEKYGEISLFDIGKITGTYHLSQSESSKATLKIDKANGKVFNVKKKKKSTHGEISIIKDKLLYDGSRYLSGDKFCVLYNEDKTLSLRFYGYTGLGFYDGDYIKQI